MTYQSAKITGLKKSITNPWVNTS